VCADLSLYRLHLTRNEESQSCWSCSGTERLDEDLEKAGVTKNLELSREMVNDFLRNQHDEFRPGSRSHDVKAIETQKELVLFTDLVGVTECKGGDDHVSLLPLESFNSVDRFADRCWRDTGRGEERLKAAHDKALLGPVRRDDANGLLPEVLRGVERCRSRDFNAGEMVSFLCE